VAVQGTNGQVTYHLQADGTDRAVDVSINATTGIVSTRAMFDREVSPTVRLLVHAVDNGSVSRTATATVDITITDLDDESAEFTKEWSVNYRIRRFATLPFTYIGCVIHLSRLITVSDLQC